VRGLLELASGWWVMVGTYTDPRTGPCVTMVMQFDPEGELPNFGIKAVRMSEMETGALLGLLDQAMTTIGDGRLRRD